MLRKWIGIVAIAAALPSGADALEKIARRIDDETARGDWSGGCSSKIAYYNYCNGWIWTWGGWEPGARMGVRYFPVENHPLCDVPNLLQTTLLVHSGPPVGYGFTGTIGLYGMDAKGCASELLQSQPFLPDAEHAISVVPWLGISPNGSFWIIVELGATAGNPSLFATDHPAAGPTGPAACGSCFPTSRTVHSFFVVEKGGVLCAGPTFADDLCDAELVWDTFGSYREVIAPVSVESGSWGQIKALYR